MKNHTKNLILVALFAALTAVGAFLKIPIGPAPISLQTLFTILSGILLGPWLGSLSQLIYILIGLCGVPVFTAGGGPAYIFQPDFGYLIGFLIMPLIIGSLLRGKKLTFLRVFVSCLPAVLAGYLIGVPYMYLILHGVSHVNLSFAHTVVVGCVVFLPGDLIKTAVAALVGCRIAPVIRGR